MGKRPQFKILEAMKAKIFALFVISGLTISMVASGVAAVSLAVKSEPSSAEAGQPAWQRSQVDAPIKDGALLSSFKFVCPFH